MPQPTPEEREQGRQQMAQHAARPKTRHLFERLLRLAADKGDHEQVAERLSWGIDPNCRSPKLARTPLIRNCTNHAPESRVVKVLLDAGADHTIADARGHTALDYARRRLARFEGKPRKAPRRSPSLTPHGDVKLHDFEHRMLDRFREKHPEHADDYEEIYLHERRKAAERVFDTRGELEKIVVLLEAAEPTPKP